MMDQQFERETASRNAVVRCLADGDRRRIFSLLRERESPTSVDDLATRLAARAGDEPADSVTADARRRQRTRLHHEHLPAMVEAGLIDRDREAGTVVAVDHPVVDDLGIDAMCSDPAVDDEDVDERLRALADARRRTALSILAERRAATTVRTLTRDVVAREMDAPEENVSESAVDRAHVSLVHAHLPALAAADLVEYDAEAGLASADGRWATRVRRSADPDRREHVRSTPSR